MIEQTRQITGERERLKYSQMSELPLVSPIETFAPWPRILPNAPAPTESKEVLKARQILGKLARDLSTEEIEIILTEVQYLTESWIDEFERQIFKGKTLQQTLNEGNSL